MIFVNRKTNEKVEVQKASPPSLPGYFIKDKISQIEVFVEEQEFLKKYISLENLWLKYKNVKTQKDVLAYRFDPSIYIPEEVKNQYGTQHFFIEKDGKKTYIYKGYWLIKEGDDLNMEYDTSFRSNYQFISETILKDIPEDTYFGVFFSVLTNNEVEAERWTDNYVPRCITADGSFVSTQQGVTIKKKMEKDNWIVKIDGEKYQMKNSEFKKFYKLKIKTVCAE